MPDTNPKPRSIADWLASRGVVMGDPDLGERIIRDLSRGGHEPPREGDEIPPDFTPYDLSHK
ncbi:MAG: hypothetical protein WDO56_24235 [Gammaproteobacteria bacterium]